MCADSTIAAFHMIFNFCWLLGYWETDFDFMAKIIHNIGIAFVVIDDNETSAKSTKLTEAKCGGVDLGEIKKYVKCYNADDLKAIISIPEKWLADLPLLHWTTKNNPSLAIFEWWNHLTNSSHINDWTIYSLSRTIYFWLNKLQLKALQCHRVILRPDNYHIGPPHCDVFSLFTCNN